MNKQLLFDIEQRPANIKRIEKARPHTRGTLKNQSPGS